MLSAEEGVLFTLAQVMNIETTTQQAGKTYDFDQGHDPRKLAQHWFQTPPEGLTLFIVFYTMACRWSRCLGCNLPSKMSKRHVPFGDLMAQVDDLFETILDEEKKTGLKKIILSNNGSVLDEETFSTTALMYFIAMMNLHCPNLSVLSIETRPEYIDWEELEIIARALNEGATPTDLEVAVGFEAYDDTIRNEYFHKGMPLPVFENMVAKLAKYGFKLKAYFMQKPVPNLSEVEGIRDIVLAIDYLDDIADRYAIELNMHLNPTYVAAGTVLESAFHNGTYSPPQLESVRTAVLHAENKRISIYVGLNDEGLAVPGGGFVREGDEALVQALERFNETGDFALLRST